MKKWRIVAGLFVGTLMMTSAQFGGVGGCGGEGGGGGGGDATGDLGSVTVAETSVAEGSDFNPAVSFYATDGGGIGFTVSGADVDGDGTVGAPTVSNVTVEEGDTIALALNGTKRVSVAGCDSRDVGSGSSDDQFDIAVSLDTTASMGSAAGILASKIADFATALADAGVDAQFAGITVGDAFATKLSSGSSFTDSVSLGSLGEPPSFDSCERPDTGESLISATNMATFFNEVESVVGSGCSGAGLPENYLGPLQLAHDEVSFRSGAARIFISIGDNCAYTPGTASQDSIVDPWTPPDPSTLEAALSGVATVHVIGNPESTLGCETSSYYNMEDLSNATGGTFTEIGGCGSATTCNVDLTELPILTSITSGTVTECDFTTESAAQATLCFDVSADGGDAGFCAVLNLTAE